MPKLGVITDGISREFEHALSVMNETGLEYAELQYLWEKEVGDLNDTEISSQRFYGKNLTFEVVSPTNNISNIKFVLIFRNFCME